MVSALAVGRDFLWLGNAEILDSQATIDRLPCRRQREDPAEERSRAVPHRDLVLAIDGPPFFGGQPIEVGQILLGLHGAFLDLIEKAARQVSAKQSRLRADEPGLDGRDAIQP